MLAGELVQKVIAGINLRGSIKIQLTEIGHVGASGHVPAYAIEIYVEDESGHKHIDVRSWEAV
jgi:hypothetical protein